MKNKINGLLVFVGLIMIVPLTYKLPSRNLIIVVTVFSFFIINLRSINSRNLRFLFLFLMTVLSFFVISYWSENYYIFNRYLIICVALLFVVTLNSLIQPIDFKFSIKAPLLLGLGSAIYLIYIQSTSPYASRQIRLSDIDTLSYAGLGGYEFVYSVVVVIVSLYFCTSFRKFRNINMTELLVLSILFACVVISNFLTALLLLFFALFLNFSRKTKLVAFLLVLSLWGGQERIIQFIAFLPNGEIQVKVLAIVEALQGSIKNLADIEFVQGRMLKYEESWEQFLDNPIFGIASEKINYSDGFLVGFGQHSFILDTLALFGVFGLLFLVVFFILAYKQAAYMLPSRYARIVTITIALLSLINNLSFDIIVSGFFVGPYLFYSKIAKSASHLTPPPLRTVVRY